MSTFLLLVLISVNFACCEVVLKQKCFTSLSDGSNCDKIPREVENFSYPLPQDYFGTVCCYEDGLGCFSNKQGTPFECFPGPPDCMDKIRPYFYLYTSENDTQFQSFDFFNLNSKTPQLEINSSKNLFLIIHGFGDEWPKPWITDLKNALISLDCNVLVVRWTGGSQNYCSLFNYFKAAANTRSTGAAVAKVIRTMIRYKKLDLAKTTIIGYSLGAHVAGHIGRKLDGLKRIIALDPAGPLFTCQNPLVRLDPTDAEYVEVFHTNGDDFFFGGIGTMQAMGHVDFYANGGRLQPGCKRGQYQSLQDKFFWDVSDTEGEFWCSHARAPIILTESIRNSLTPLNSCKYSSFPCPSDEDWSAGLCFSNSSDGLSLRMGKYYFNTLNENVTSGQFCGLQVLLSLTSDSDIEGKIVVQFQLSSRQKTADFIFQNLNDTLHGQKQKSVIFTLNWEWKNIVDVFLSYFPNSNLSHSKNQQKTEWNLTNWSIDTSQGKKVRSLASILIKPSVPTNIIQV